MAEYFDRYEYFRTNLGTTCLPFIKISESPSDKKVVYKKGRTRFDKLSQDYYGNPYHGWLILSANPQYGGLEFDIPDNTVIRIPFPFKTALSSYKTEAENYIILNGK